MESRTCVVVDGALFSGDGKLLLLKRRADDAWELPCGPLEFGEEPEVAASRLFLELTGIDAVPDRPLGAWGGLNEKNGIKYHHVHIGYTMSLTGTLLSVELESAVYMAFCWATAQELAARVENPALKRSCERAFAALVRGRKNK